MKKIPSPELIKEMDEAFENNTELLFTKDDVSDFFKSYKVRGFNQKFDDWAHDIEIPRRFEMGLFSDFFDWCVISDSPLYKAMRENDED